VILNEESLDHALQRRIRLYCRNGSVVIGMSLFEWSRVHADEENLYCLVCSLLNVCVKYVCTYIHKSHLGIDFFGFECSTAVT
jgi:hypothetical protein